MAGFIAVIVGFVLFFNLGTGPFRNQDGKAFLAAVIGGIFAYAVVKGIRAERANCEQHRLRQRELQDQVLYACETSIAAFEAIPKYLWSAEQLLDRAQEEFRDGAFSPFWDFIERAISRLGDVELNVKQISDSYNSYQKLTASYEGQPPPFPVDPEFGAKASNRERNYGASGRSLPAGTAEFSVRNDLRTTQDE